MSIIGVTGDPGTGKTALLTWFGLQAHEKGTPVLANFPLDFAEPWDPTKEPPEGEFLLLLQEAGVILDSRLSGSPINTHFTQWLVQLRKMGCDLVWDAQFPAQVDLRLRRLTDRWIEAIGDPASVKATGVGVYRLGGGRFAVDLKAIWHHYDTRARSKRPPPKEKKKRDT